MISNFFKLQARVTQFRSRDRQDLGLSCYCLRSLLLLPAPASLPALLTNPSPLFPLHLCPWLHSSECGGESAFHGTAKALSHPDALLSGQVSAVSPGLGWVCATLSSGLGSAPPFPPLSFSFFFFSSFPSLSFYGSIAAHQSPWFAMWVLVTT